MSFKRIEVGICFEFFASIKSLVFLFRFFLIIISNRPVKLTFLASSGGSLVSLNSGEHHSGRVARWAVSIDAVLNDNLGRMAFRMSSK